MPYLRVKTGSVKGKVYEIKDAVLSIGRDETQTIQILDQGVSRAHAEVFRIGEMCFVRDLDSTNGTYLNDSKVSEESLKAGDELQIGSTVLAFEDHVPAVSTGETTGVEFTSEEKIEAGAVELRIDDPVGRSAPEALGRELQSRNMTLLSQIGRIIRGQRDLKRAFERAVEVVCGAVKADHGYLFLRDRETGQLAPRVVVEGEDAAGGRKVSRTILDRVMSTSMPLLTSDASADGRLTRSESVQVRKIRSAICVPVQVDDQVEGLLYFHSDRLDGALTLEDLELAASVGLQLSLAVTQVAVSDRIRKDLLATIRALASGMEVIDPRHQGHSQRVSDYAAAVAAQIGLGKEDVHRVRLAALLHDVGKLAVHQAVSGAGAEQFSEQHVFAGEKILTGIDGFEEILPGVKYHHERADGGGYPYRIKNSDTPLLARIVIVANAFDNACNRGGADGLPVPSKDVVKDMVKRGGAEFDEDVVKALVICHRNGTLHGGEAAPAE